MQGAASPCLLSGRDLCIGPNCASPPLQADCFAPAPLAPAVNEGAPAYQPQQPAYDATPIPAADLPAAWAPSPLDAPAYFPPAPASAGSPASHPGSGGPKPHPGHLLGGPPGLWLGVPPPVTAGALRDDICFCSVAVSLHYGQCCLHAGVCWTPTYTPLAAGWAGPPAAAGELPVPPAALAPPTWPGGAAAAEGRPQLPHKGRKSGAH